MTLREKCPYSVLFWSLFSRIDWIQWGTLYLSVFSPNAEKYGPEQLRIRTLFTPCDAREFMMTNQEVLSRLWIMCRKMCPFNCVLEKSYLFIECPNKWFFTFFVKILGIFVRLVQNLILCSKYTLIRTYKLLIKNNFLNYSSDKYLKISSFTMKRKLIFVFKVFELLACDWRKECVKKSVYVIGNGIKCAISFKIDSCGNMRNRWMRYNMLR